MTDWETATLGQITSDTSMLRAHVYDLHRQIRTLRWVMTLQFVILAFMVVVNS